MKQWLGARTRETGDPRENSSTSGIIRHDSHVRKPGGTPPGIEPGLFTWKSERSSRCATAAPKNGPDNLTIPGDTTFFVPSDLLRKLRIVAPTGINDDRCMGASSAPHPAAKDYDIPFELTPAVDRLVIVGSSGHTSYRLGALEIESITGKEEETVADMVTSLHDSSASYGEIWASVKFELRNFFPVFNEALRVGERERWGLNKNGMQGRGKLESPEKIRRQNASTPEELEWHIEPILYGICCRTLLLQATVSRSAVNEPVCPSLCELAWKISVERQFRLKFVLTNGHLITCNLIGHVRKMLMESAAKEKGQATGNTGVIIFPDEERFPWEGTPSRVCVIVWRLGGGGTAPSPPPLHPLYFGKFAAENVRAREFGLPLLTYFTSPREELNSSPLIAIFFYSGHSSACMWRLWDAVAERLACSPLTNAIRVQSPARPLDFSMWESCRTIPLAGGPSRGLPPSLHSGAALYSPQSLSSAVKTTLILLSLSPPTLAVIDAVLSYLLCLAGLYLAIGYPRSLITHYSFLQLAWVRQRHIDAKTRVSRRMLRVFAGRETFGASLCLREHLVGCLMWYSPSKRYMLSTDNTNNTVARTDAPINRQHWDYTGQHSPSDTTFRMNWDMFQALGTLRLTKRIIKEGCERVAVVRITPGAFKLLGETIINPCGSAEKSSDQLENITDPINRNLTVCYGLTKRSELYYRPIVMRLNYCCILSVADKDSGENLSQTLLYR
ncbi:hypothetical protein PR048_005920 [Dryococelus australis]|uniref:Uncharacterized protein n=1 Tax=Dryococelus australis TaxID=614101 RepID=A0ABQ9I9K5_9NEOP|nr:hypothetical protein PR048_005920 [Dryococelus australis]